MEAISLYATPVLIFIILVSGVIAKLPLYELFVEGAMEGLEMCVKILPYVLGMLVAIAIFRSSGALEALSAVSYTHLDVYKRQGISPLLVFTTLGKASSCKENAVSYTHLDVYKRQNI